MGKIFLHITHSQAMSKATGTLRMGISEPHSRYNISVRAGRSVCSPSDLIILII